MTSKSEPAPTDRKGKSPAHEPRTAREERARSARIQDEPESTIGRKPAELEHPERPEHGRSRS